MTTLTILAIIRDLKDLEDNAFLSVPIRRKAYELRQFLELLGHEHPQAVHLLDRKLAEREANQ